MSQPRSVFCAKGPSSSGAIISLGSNARAQLNPMNDPLHNLVVAGAHSLLPLVAVYFVLFQGWNMGSTCRHDLSGIPY